jgi:S1-C subfamily serine protease
MAKGADATAPAKDESAQAILDQAIKLYADCKTYTAKISSRQVFLTSALPVFSGAVMPQIDFRTAIYQSLTVRMKRPGNWSVSGDLISDPTPLRSAPQVSGAQSYVVGKTAGSRGNLAILRGTAPTVVSELSEEDLSGELAARLVGRGCFILEPLLPSAGPELAASYPQDNPQLEAVEEAQGRTLYRIRVQGANNANALLWIDKATHQIWRTFSYTGSVVQQFTETLYFDQHFDEALPDESFTFAAPTAPNPLVPSALGFAELWQLETALPDLLQPKTIVAKPVQAASRTNKLDATQAMLAGVVIVEGNEGVATGFVAKIRNIPFVVTNLHVLGDNTTLTVKTLKGELLPWQQVAGAVGADIALLRIVKPDAAPTPLPLAADVMKSTKIGDDVVVVGNRLGGGVATQVTGQVRGVGPNRIEIDAPFEPGNSGSPVFDATTGEVLGIAAYTETVKVDTSSLKNGGYAMRTAEKRWFAFRLDTVANWEPIDLNRWHAQMKRVSDFHDTSTALLAFLQGHLDEAGKEPRLRSMITHLDVDLNDPTVLASRPNRDDVVREEVGDMVRRAQGFAAEGLKDFSTGTYYDYFLSSPYAPENVNDQVELRNDLIDAFKEVLADLATYQARFGGAASSKPSNSTGNGRAGRSGSASQGGGFGG